MRPMILSVLLLFCGAAQALTIDFEELTPQTSSPFLAFTSQGFDLYGSNTSLYGPGYNFVGGGQNGTQVFGGVSEYSHSQDGFGPSVYFSMAREDGAAFSLYSLDLFTSGPPNIYITGVSAGGGYVYANSTPLGTGDWLNVVEVSITLQGDGFNYWGVAAAEIDNIVVGAAVPVPAAVWLFASGLGILGWLRSRYQRPS